MDGWCSVEELTQRGFAHAPVLMANEAHNGRQRCVRTRVVGARMVRAAHEAGVRRLAPGEPLLVWSGNSHVAKESTGEWVPMGCHFPGHRITAAG